MNKPKRKFSWFWLFIPLLVMAYLTGPRPHVTKPISKTYNYGQDLHRLDDSLRRSESSANVRPGNNAHILWGDTIGAKTDIVFVYIHGFSASHEEGHPLHTRLAEHFGANLLLTRLQAHGLVSDEPLLDFKAQDYVNSVDKAIALGRSLGDTVILLACSTGGTGALYSAAQSYDVDGILLYSPNIDLASPAAPLLTKPYGLQIARLVNKGKYRTWDCPDDALPYWYGTYRLESILELKAMIDHCMTLETFQKIKAPVFLAYYYKNEEEQDQVVSVRRMLEMYEQLGTPENLKQKIAFAKVGNHGLLNTYFSDDYETVIERSIAFIDSIIRR